VTDGSSASAQAGQRVIGYCPEASRLAMHPVVRFRIVAHWGASQRPPLAGVMWMAVLLGILVWLDDQHEGIFLVPPFAATMSILLYLPSRRRQ